MATLFLVASAFFLSAAVGFAVNRTILFKTTPSPARAIALAVSRAVFYAPAFIQIGHGARLPVPMLTALENPDFLTFLLPGLVFLGSLAWDSPKKQRREPDEPTNSPSGV